MENEGLKIIKQDLLESISKDKYYKEIDLMNIINKNIPYEEKINEIRQILRSISQCDSEAKLTNEYFEEIKRQDPNKKQKK